MSKIAQIETREVEKSLLAGLLKYPRTFYDFEAFIKEEDFQYKFHKVLFNTIKELISQDSSVDYSIVAERIINNGIKVIDDISVIDYVSALYLREIEETSIVDIAKELARKTFARRKVEDLRKAATYLVQNAGAVSYDEMVETVDKLVNTADLEYESSGQLEPIDVLGGMEDFIEGVADNPPNKDDFLYSPFPILNSIYDSLVKPGNICLIASGTGVGKSTLKMVLCIHYIIKYNIPILYCDVGEMDEDMIRLRLCSQLSGVSYFYLEKGLWRKNKEMYEKVRAVWPKVKEYSKKLMYVDIAGLTTTQIISFIKRYYMTKIGRGNPMILSIDYLKTSGILFENNDQEHKQIADFVDRLKKLIKTDLKFDGKRHVSMLTSLQTTREGTTAGKKSADLKEDESILSLSQRISHLVSHTFYYRKLVEDELLLYGQHFNATHLMRCFKPRILGEDINGHLSPVRLKDRLVSNAILFQSNNFDIIEKADLRMVSKFLEEGAQPIRDDVLDDLPEF